MHYLIGDIQGCCDPFDRLLAEIGFSPSRDTLYLLGDLVNRGPKSLEVLRRVRGFGDSAVTLLGNHDIHLLAVAHGVRKAGRSDTLAPVLEAPDRNEWMDWLRHRRMAWRAQGWLMVHAGVPPQWDADKTLRMAAELEARFTGPDLKDFLSVIFANEPARWRKGLEGPERWRFAINAFTRMRWCTEDGTLDFKAKNAADGPPPGHMAWFDVPGRRTAGTRVAFGHWSTLGLLDRPDLLATDTGCVWGGKLTAVRIDESGTREVIQVACEKAQEPGE
ncbi:MAG: symmetrical bis(5'-nucleosyl)-tetraphosphatase [Aquabacterium sp.]|nr:MAG: symmetrical bis(5'-nucleosyl)-tetraphosphatase [Aquabacterium sp.]